jgi:hypothetical protein
MSAGLAMSQSNPQTIVPQPKQIDQQATGIVVLVRDPSGAVVRDARIQVMTPSKVALVRGATSNAGEWRFSGMPPGTYVIEISAHSLETYTEQINVTLQAITRLDVVLKVPKEIWTGPVAEPAQVEEPPETPIRLDPVPQPVSPQSAQANEGTSGIALVVKDPAGIVVSKAHVKLTRAPENFQADGTTNKAGQWKLAGLAAGSYVMEITMPPGFSPYKETVNLESRAITNLEVTLKLSTCCTGPQVEPVRKNPIKRLFHKLGF